MSLLEHQRRIAGIGKVLIRKFLNDRCTTYAAALAFSSMLSIVPFLAVLFAILKALDVHTTIAPVILANVSAGSHEIVNRILDYVNNISVASLGGVGLMTLFLSAIGTLDSLEEAFNQIWGLELGKKYHHKLRDYLLVIFSFPLLISLTVTITTSLEHHLVVQWFFRLPLFGHLLLALFRLVPYLSIWIALASLYLVIPNTRIRLRNALAGGVAAGTVWQLTQWVYIHLQMGVSRSNAIYGTLALLPVFMIWIYTAWIVVLGGMELVWYLQGGANPRGRKDMS